MTIGPSMPPHLVKRAREDDNNRSTSPESSEKRRRVAGPAAPSRIVGPALPPSYSRSSSEDSDVGPAPPPPPPASKPTRVLGPSAPPATLSERPLNPPSDNSDSDSSDDDFGPAPPPAGIDYSTYDDDKPTKIGPSVFDTDEQYVEQAKKIQRDEWMTLPPTQDDLAARMDPTKIRARKFNSGKGARAPTGDSMGVWTETPEQKLKRLQNEALGITAPANSSVSNTQDTKRSKEEEHRIRKMKEKVEKARGSSLMEKHLEKDGGKEKEDDPSKRAFDYEKDMGMGMKIGHKQRNEMLNKAKGFGDRFSSGNFL